MNRRDFLATSALGSALPALRAAAAPPPPNILLIIADDLGYGDLSCYGASGVRTPNIDRLAARGVRFTDAHTSAATCTPSRYSLLTGEYSFRLPEAQVLPGDAPLLIRPGRATLPALLKSRGYHTGVIGKWHLGLGSGDVNWNGDIQPGPLEIGFDESFIIPATGDRVPCVYVENHRVANLDPADPIKVSYKGPLDDSPTGATRPDLLRMKPSHGHDMTIVNGISRIGFMSGGKRALWNDDTMADTLTARAVRFLENNQRKPFFLYFATHDIHVPRVPNDRFAGSTQMGPRGNVIAELDWSVGRLLETLDRLKLTSNTLIIVTSDNGAVVDDGYQDQAVEKLGSHKPNGPLRGGKYSRFEGGTRVPLILNWPGRAKPGVSDALLSQVDLTASFASLAGAQVPSGAAPDSENLLPTLLGEKPAGREVLVEQAQSLTLRMGKWKLIPANKGPAVNKNTNTEMGGSPVDLLYDLSTDLGETHSVAAQHPEIVKDMTARLQKIRSAPPASR